MAEPVPTSILILLVDDHALFREGLASVLAARMPQVELHTASDETAATSLLDQHRFDLVLLDLALGTASGLALLLQWQQQTDFPPVVVLSASSEPTDMQSALAAGARGYIPKTVSGALLVSAIELVRAGGVYVPPELLGGLPATSPKQTSLAPLARVGGNDPLTPRQIEVLGLLAEGRSNKDIARKLDMADGTVRTHINAIFRALDASNRTQAVMRAQQLGWI